MTGMSRVLCAPADTLRSREFQACTVRLRFATLVRHPQAVGHTEDHFDAVHPDSACSGVVQGLPEPYCVSGTLHSTPGSRPSLRGRFANTSQN